MQATVTVDIRQGGAGLLAKVGISPLLPHANSYDFEFSADTLRSALARVKMRQNRMPAITVSDRQMHFELNGSRFEVVEQVEKVFMAFEGTKPADFVSQVAQSADQVLSGKVYEYGLYFAGSMDCLYATRERTAEQGAIVADGGIFLMDVETSSLRLG